MHLNDPFAGQEQISRSLDPLVSELMDVLDKGIPADRDMCELYVATMLASAAQIGIESTLNQAVTFVHGRN